MNKAQLVEILKAGRNTFNDEIALIGKELYPVWAVGIVITQDDLDNGKDRYQHDGILWRCIKPHTTQESWKPSINTTSLWVAINEGHAGTMEDPIPAVRGMEYVYGLYYVEADKLYRCHRNGEAEGGKVTLQYLPSELVGQYFVLVEKEEN